MLRLPCRLLSRFRSSLVRRPLPPALPPSPSDDGSEDYIVHPCGMVLGATPPLEDEGEGYEVHPCGMVVGSWSPPGILQRTWSTDTLCSDPSEDDSLHLRSDTLSWFQRARCIQAGMDSGWAHEHVPIPRIFEGAVMVSPINERFQQRQ
uniref:Uncharacterized protein n=1 Tax=Chromera velia CCMP2878 TaxID=1169474 RepID=A0A0G4H941_9ALVE|eukprot:Cvel_25335.t1-p1 / transcript=Cvel_25335.t1 / gene=Cvel_25335 / organism=Chromera_velia_CCMP2878 / gene_product=hypothetical protein / transcript_product=hypothetical protein / location=Cvel_scaffold2856:21007-21450(-) / protein_length=148 / sequence_SO=supercontig / SO=protein_coding / is_pseudo=false